MLLIFTTKNFENQHLYLVTNALSEIKNELSIENKKLYSTIDHQIIQFNTLQNDLNSKQNTIEALKLTTSQQEEIATALTDKVKMIQTIKSDEKKHRDLHIVISTEENKLWLKRGNVILKKFRVATGFKSVEYTKDNLTTRNISITPKGVMTVRKMVKNPVWIKPDWFFTERKLPIPPLNSPLRRDKKALGPYAIYLQKRYIIHGTYNARDLGRNVSHGCVRILNDKLQILFKNVDIGTKVYIY